MMDELLAENSLKDLLDIAAARDRVFANSDIEQLVAAGIKVHEACTLFIQRYEGNKSFVKNMQRRLHKGIPITQGMFRVILDIMREEAQAGRTADMVPELDTQQEHVCFTCQRDFATFDALDQHRIKDHGAAERPEVVADIGDAKAVIADTTSTRGLDLSNLPDGRYAAPDPSGKNEYVFLMVRRARKTTQRDRRYVYGKITTGNEVVVAGTIEVKVWSSDSKELIGEQKPGDAYRGEYEDELELIMMFPEKMAQIFGVKIGACCICGKTLTDDISRQIGMGLDCEKKENYFRKPPEYTYLGADRPDPSKADPNDDKYLNGVMRYYVKPPETPAQPQQASTAV